MKTFFLKKRIPLLCRGAFPPKFAKPGSVCKKTRIFLFALAFASFFASCANIPQQQPPALLWQAPPEYIMGEGRLSAEQMTLFLMQNNPQADIHFVRMLANLYVEEAAKEGVNHDIAFAQMSLETGFLRFGNLVSPDQNNFAGLGATGLPGPDGLPERGLYFSNPRIGVRAHIQHLKAYACTEPLNMELVNPRFHLVERFIGRGTAPTIQGLTGTWAADPLYSEKIADILMRLYEFSFS
ncbi:MAG: glucosaminidase domain-containing protein [Spirochaetes bacterium]|nr:glucosaminidase domain-containing protein [Spirochaetota bacterium]